MADTTEELPAPAAEDKTPKTPADLSILVEDLLQQMQTRFSDLGLNITSRMEEMGQRMDELEQSIGELMDAAGLPRNSVLSPPPTIAPAATMTSPPRPPVPQSPASSASKKSATQRPSPQPPAPNTQVEI